MRAAQHGDLRRQRRVTLNESRTLGETGEAISFAKKAAVSVVVVQALEIWVVAHDALRVTG
jgi:hypothetical protein